MQYLGGKSKISKVLGAAIRPRLAGRPFWDAFCGGLSMSCELARIAGKGLVTDANPALVALYAAVAGGWKPPTFVGEDEYRAARELPDTDPRKAFIGFGCSFGGKWFGGYARTKDPNDSRGLRSYATSASNVVLRDVAHLVASGCEFARVDFLSVEPRATPLVLYLDPPYMGCTKYGATGEFDYDKFYARVRGWAAHTDVFVSEYDMPFGTPLLEFSHDMSVAGGVHKDARTERLYHFRGAC